MAAGAIRTEKDEPAARPAMPPQCRTISVKDFRDWFAGASAGGQCIYAHGASLDQQRDVVVLARQFANDKLVDLHSPRGSDGQFLWMAVKRHDPREAASTPQRAAPPPAESPAGRCLAILRRAANFDLPCPTNTDLARALGLSDRQAARYIMQILAEEGHIGIESRGPRVTRVVTIRASGKTTSRAMTPVGRGAAR